MPWLLMKSRLVWHRFFFQLRFTHSSRISAEFSNHRKRRVAISGVQIGRRADDGNDADDADVADDADAADARRHQTATNCWNVAPSTFQGQPFGPLPAVTGFRTGLKRISADYSSLLDDISVFCCSLPKFAVPFNLKFPRAEFQ